MGKLLHIQVLSSYTKSCGFSEESQKRYFFILRFFSGCEGSCSQEANAKGSLVPLGKRQLLCSKKESLRNKNAALAAAFLPSFMPVIEKAFFSQAQKWANYYLRFLPRWKEHIQESQSENWNSHTSRKACESAYGCLNCQDEPGSLPASKREES